jgi:hypothetical protein
MRKLCLCVVSFGFFVEIPLHTSVFYNSIEQPTPCLLRCGFAKAQSFKAGNLSISPLPGGDEYPLGKIFN